MCLVLAVALLCGGGAWLAAAILFHTDPVEPAAAGSPATGIAVIRSIDNHGQVKISMAGDQVAIFDLQELPTKEIAKEITLKAGKYDVELLKAREGVKLKSSHLTIQNGQRSEIEVMLDESYEEFDFNEIGVNDSGGPKDKGSTSPGPKTGGQPPTKHVGPLRPPPWGPGPPPQFFKKIHP